MRTLFLSATAPDSGQTLMAWLLAMELADRSLKVGLFRPMGVAGPDGGDPTMKLLFDALGDKVVGQVECPVTIDPEGGVDPDLASLYYDKIKKAFEWFEGKCDVCLVIGSRDVFFDAEQHSLPDTKFIEMFDARVLLIDRYISKAMTVYSNLALASFLRERLAGIVVNYVSDKDWEEFSGKTAPFLRSKGAPILAVLPKDPVLGSPTLQDIAEILDAKVLTGEDAMRSQITGKTISAHELPKSLRIFKRVVNKILLTGGPTQEIEAGNIDQLCGAVITAGRNPAQPVLDAAIKEGWPMLLTEKDTFGAIDTLDNAKLRLKPRDTFKVDHLRKILTAQLPMDELMAAFGL